jgi:CHASE2 domain-containing sensor protein
MRQSIFSRARAAIQSYVASTAFRYENIAAIALAIVASLFATFHFAQSFLNQSSGAGAQDAILKTRFSSPVASPEIVILDIDERSLGMLAPQHGRWPWPRAVLADGLSKVLAEQPRAVIFNVLISDPDLDQPDGDALLDYVAASSRNAVFPVIRLNPENDDESDLAISLIPGSIKVDSGAEDSTTIAAVIPVLVGMQSRLGVTNIDTDEDGIARHYAYRPEYAGWSVPSLVSATLAVAAPAAAMMVPDDYRLNWRNKRGQYTRVSFGDYILNKHVGTALKDKFVIVGVSAAGVGQVIPTAVSPVVDSNEILATAIDDALNSTWLRVVPAWGEWLLSILAAWGLIFVRAQGVKDSALEISFLVAQASMAGACLILASYSNLLVDVSYPMGILLGVFSGIGMTNALSKRWGSAYVGFRDQADSAVSQCVVVGISSDGSSKTDAARRLRSQLSDIFGWDYVLRVDELFDGRSIVGESLKGMAFICGPVNALNRERVAQILSESDSRQVAFCWMSPQVGWAPNDPAFREFITREVLALASELMTKRGSVP